MKANLKGLGGIKGMALAHGEKLGMAIVALLSLFLIYKALQQPSLDANRQPNELERLITEAKSSVEKADFATASTDFVRRYHPISKAPESTIPEKAYSASINWDPSVVPPVVLRTDPELLAAQKVEANGGSGLLAFTNDAIRKQRELEMQQEAERKEKAQQKEQDRLQKDAETGKNQRPNAANKAERGRGGEIADPEHPNRRQLLGMTRQVGIPTAGDEEIRTAYWAAVLAKVPIKDQFKLYRGAFENARGYSPEADFPRYLGFRVKRAEVLPGQEVKEDDFKPISVYNGKGEAIAPAVYSLAIFGRAADEASGTAAKRGMTTDWAAQSEEIVDPRYLDEGGVLAVPLPPLVGRDWGVEATHSEIPLASKATVTDEEAAKPDDDKPLAPAAAPEEDFSATDPAAAGGPRGRVMGGRGSEERGRGGSTYGRGAPMMRDERGSGRAPVAGARGGASVDIAPQVPYCLLRFFDFSVEPGKKYKYRVQLVLQDPNQSSDSTHAVATESLDTAVINRIKAEKKKTTFRTTDWSDPSPTVSIPLAGNVHVAAAKPASDRFNDEPATTLLVESFGSDDKGKSTQAAKEEDFKRGSVANMTKDAEFVGNDGAQPYIDLAPKFKFQTGITILDIDGGDPLPPSKDLKRPARVLLMDPAGQLFVQNEVADTDAVQFHRDTFAEPDKQRGGRPGPTAPGGREGPRGAAGFQQGFGRGER
jgi:hypothetical protein